MVKEISPPSARYTASLDTASSSRLPIPSKIKQPSLFAKPKSTRTPSTSAGSSTSSARKRTILGERSDIDNVSISSSRGRPGSSSKGTTRSPVKRPVTIVTRIASSAPSATATPRGLPSSRLSLGKRGTPHPRQSMTMAFPRTGDESRLMDVEPPEWISGLSSPVSSDYEDAETTFRGHGNGRSGAVMGVGRMMTPADSQEAPTGRIHLPSPPIDRRSRLPTPPSSQVHEDLPLPSSFSAARAKRVHPRPAPTPPRQTREPVVLPPHDPSPNPRHKKSPRINSVPQSPSQARFSPAVSRPLSASISAKLPPSLSQLPSTPSVSHPSASLKQRPVPSTAPPARRRKSTVNTKKTPSPKKSRKSLPAYSTKLKTSKPARKSLSVQEIVKITGTPLGRLTKKVEAEPGDDELLLKEEEDDDVWLRKRRMSRSLSMTASRVSMGSMGSPMGLGFRHVKAGPSRLRNVVEVEIIQRHSSTTPRPSPSPEPANLDTGIEEQMSTEDPAENFLASAVPEEDSGSYDLQYDEAPGWISDDATEVGDDEDSTHPVAEAAIESAGLREDTVIGISHDTDDMVGKVFVDESYGAESGVKTPKHPIAPASHPLESTTPLEFPGAHGFSYSGHVRPPLEVLSLMSPSPRQSSAVPRGASPREDADETQEAVSEEWDISIDHAQPVFEDQPIMAEGDSVIASDLQEDFDHVSNQILSPVKLPDGSPRALSPSPLETCSPAASEPSTPIITSDEKDLEEGEGSTEEAIAEDWDTSIGSGEAHYADSVHIAGTDNETEQSQQRINDEPTIDHAGAMSPSAPAAAPARTDDIEQDRPEEMTTLPPVANMYFVGERDRDRVLDQETIEVKVDNVEEHVDQAGDELDTAIALSPPCSPEPNSESKSVESPIDNTELDCSAQLDEVKDASSSLGLHAQPDAETPWLQAISIEERTPTYEIGAPQTDSLRSESTSGPAVQPTATSALDLEPVEQVVSTYSALSPGIQAPTLVGGLLQEEESLRADIGSAHRLSEPPLSEGISASLSAQVINSPACEHRPCSAISPKAAEYDVTLGSNDHLPISDVSSVQEANEELFDQYISLPPSPISSSSSVEDRPIDESRSPEDKAGSLCDEVDESSSSIEPSSAPVEDAGTMSHTDRERADLGSEMSRAEIGVEECHDRDGEDRQLSTDLIDGDANVLCIDVTDAEDTRCVSPSPSHLTAVNAATDEVEPDGDESSSSIVGDKTEDGESTNWDVSVDALQLEVLPSSTVVSPSSILVDSQDCVEEAQEKDDGYQEQTDLPLTPLAVVRSDRAAAAKTHIARPERSSTGPSSTHDGIDSGRQVTASTVCANVPIGYVALAPGSIDEPKDNEREPSEDGTDIVGEEIEEEVEGDQDQPKDDGEQDDDKESERYSAAEEELESGAEADQAIFQPPRPSTRIILRVVDRGIVKLESPPPRQPSQVGVDEDCAPASPSPIGSQLGSTQETQSIPLSIAATSTTPATAPNEDLPAPISVAVPEADDHRHTRSSSVHRYANTLPEGISSLESMLVRRQSSSSSSSTRPSRLSAFTLAPGEVDSSDFPQNQPDNGDVRDARLRSDAVADDTLFEDVGNESFRSVVEVSSLDPRAAARAAAILKLNHAYIEHGVLPSPSATPASTTANLPTLFTPGREVPRTPRSEGRRRKWESKHFSTAESARKLNRDELLYEAELEIVAARRSRSRSRATSLGAASERGWESDETEYALPGGWKATPGKRKRSRSVRARPRLLPPIGDSQEIQTNERDVRASDDGRETDKQGGRAWGIPDWKKLEKVYRAEKEAWIEERQVKPLPGLFGWAKKVLTGEPEVKEWDNERVVRRFVEAENAEGLNGEWAEKMILLRVKALEKRVNAPPTSRAEEKDANDKRDSKKPRFESARTENAPTTPTRDVPDEGNSTVVSIVPPSTIRRMLGYVWRPSLGDTSTITEAEGDSSIDATSTVATIDDLPLDKGKGKVVDKVENKFLSRLKHGSHRFGSSSAPSSPAATSIHSTPMKQSSSQGVSTPAIAHPASPAWTPPFPGAFRSSFNRPTGSMPDTPTIYTSTLPPSYSPGLVGYSTPKIYPTLNPPFTQRSSALKALFDTPSSSKIGSASGGGIEIQKRNGSPSVSAIVKSFEEEGTFAKHHEKSKARVDELRRVQSRN